MGSTLLGTGEMQPARGLLRIPGNASPGGGHVPPAVEEMLTTIAAGLAASVRPGAVPLTGEGLRRFARLLETPAYEAWLIAWAPAADLDLHDHGGSEGAFHVVEGRLVEASTDLARPGPPETLALSAGRGRRITATCVHRVWNPGPQAALSVHVYAPPLTTMTFFDDHPDRFLVALRTEAVHGTPEPGASR
jgi:hypothetical protein